MDHHDLSEPARDRGFDEPLRRKESFFHREAVEVQSAVNRQTIRAHSVPVGVFGFRQNCILVYNRISVELALQPFTPLTRVRALFPVLRRLFLLA